MLDHFTLLLLVLINFVLILEQDHVDASHDEYPKLAKRSDNHVSACLLTRAKLVNRLDHSSENERSLLDLCLDVDFVSVPLLFRLQLAQRSVNYGQNFVRIASIAKVPHLVSHEHVLI
jgi:hypothetical protein